MRRILAGLVVVASVALAQDRAEPPDLKRVHVLLVADTNAAEQEFNNQLKVDLDNFERLLRRTVPAKLGGVPIKLEGEAVSRRGVLAALRKIEVGPDEGLLCFFWGHGGMKANGKHYLQFYAGPMLREELLQAMEAKKAGLTVLLTDCCSTRDTVKASGVAVNLREVGGRLDPVMRSLLFRARGTVDITAAADGEPALSTRDGGFFTGALCRLVRKQAMSSLDTNSDGLVTWEEFFPRLRTETDQAFKDFRGKLIARGGKCDETQQIPRAFRLGVSARTAAKQDAPKEHVAMFGLENATTDVIAYRLRWAGADEWADHKIEPGRTRVHYVGVAAGRELPSAEVKIDKMKQVQQFDSHEFVGAGVPEAVALRSWYRLVKNPKKK